MQWMKSTAQMLESNAQKSADAGSLIAPAQGPIGNNANAPRIFGEAERRRSA
jgi:hypothetical protein